MLSKEKIFVHLPERKSEEVITLKLKIKELTMRLEEAEIFIDEQRIAIDGLIMAIEHKRPVGIYDRETRKSLEFDLSETWPTVG